MSIPGEKFIERHCHFFAQKRSNLSREIGITNALSSTGFHIIKMTENYTEDTCSEAECDTLVSSESEIFGGRRDGERFTENENSEELKLIFDLYLILSIEAILICCILLL